MKRKAVLFMATMLAALIVFGQISVFSLSPQTEAEHVFTFAELAGMEYAPGVSDASADVNGFTRIKKYEKNRTEGDDLYYIIEHNDGYLLSNTSSGTLPLTRYNSGSTTSHLYQKWKIQQLNSGKVIVRSYYNNNLCLTVNESTQVVTLSTYSSSNEYQKWWMSYSSEGNALECAAYGSPLNGFKLIIYDNYLVVSSSSYTPLGFFDCSWYVPATGLSYSSFYIAPEQVRYVTPIKTPSNANCANNWIKWTVGNTSRLTVDDLGKVTGVSKGNTTLTFTDMITRVYGTCTVHVTQFANGIYFLKNKQNSMYARVKNGTMAQGQNVVQYSFDGNIQERWLFTLNTSTGYYSIKSANSGTTSYYLSVSDDSPLMDKPIVIRSATESTLTDGMKWTFATTSSGAYKIIPKTGESNDYCLNTSTSLSTNDVNLIQSDYQQNGSYRDEWYIIKPEDPECGILTTCKTPTKTFNIKCIGSDTLGSLWFPLIQESAEIWNNSASNTNITVGTSDSPFTCEVISRVVLWNGRVTPNYGPSGEVLSIEMEINSNKCLSMGNNAKKSVITHEIGHFLALDDNPPVSSNYSLMNHSRNRDVVYEPQPYDIMNVNYIYSIN